MRKTGKQFLEGSTNGAGDASGRQDKGETRVKGPMDKYVLRETDARASPK